MGELLDLIERARKGIPYTVNADKNHMFNIDNDLQEQAKKAERMIEQMKNNCNVQVINSCKYLLPCGRCDKSGELCSQYR